MLKRFLNPRWQHPDPEVRRAAVATLRCGADADAIAQVAREDVLPALRRLAMRQCRDLDLLLEIEENDTDDTVCKEAAQHYRQVLAGLVDDGPSLAERLERAARVNNVQLIEFLARQGKDDALREQALARVEREAVLRDVALKDPNRELRLKALDRIQDEHLLTRIYEQSRTSDKLISRRVRERLDANKAQRERPRQVSAQCVQICTTVESLGSDGAWNRDEARLVDLDSRWNSLEAPYRQDYEQRFQTARQRFCAAIAENRRTEPAIRTAAEALIARLQDAHGTPLVGDEKLKSQADELETLHREVLAAWPLIERLPDAQEEQEVAIRFAAARQAVQASIAQLRRRLQLVDLCARFDSLAAHKGVIAENDVKALEHEQAALPKSPLSDDAGHGLSALQRRIDKAHHKLRQRLREQATWKEETLAGLAARLDHLQGAVTDGQAREAIAEHDAITADVEALCTIGASKERTTAAQTRLRSLAKDVQVMRAWSKFGATRALQSLCEEMETLKTSGEQPLEVARKVRAARETWKERSSNGRGADQKLWKRFDAAATEAYLPCKAYFKEQAKQRKANLERRRQVLQKLEALLGTDIGGPDQDWKLLVRTRTELLAEWHHAHPVERSNAKAMGERFDAQIAALDAALERERERCVRAREQLITEAEALAENPDKKATAEICKQLQKRWTVTVAGRRREENALWERFRGACDVVFAKRQEVFDAERESASAGIKVREGLCQQVEALLQVSAADSKQAERDLHRLQGEWARVERAPQREADALEKRFSGLVRRFAKHQRALATQAQQAQLGIMHSKATLCHEAESLAPSATTTDPAEAEAMRKRWQALPAFSDEKIEADLLSRFELALAAQTRADPAGGAAIESQAANLHEREALCLRLEILLGVDSPQQYAAARMAYQVERLSNALKQRSGASSDSAEALLRAWCLIGPAPMQHAEALETRFQRAWQTRSGQ